MKKLTLILFVTVLAVSFLLTVGPSTVLAKTYSFKYANTQSENHPPVNRWYFSKICLKKHPTENYVELYFSGVLGKEAEVLEMVKLGRCREAGEAFLKGPKKIPHVYASFPL